MTAVRVRRATPADAKAVADIHLVSRSVAMPWLPRIHTDEETLAWVREVVVPGSDVLDHLYLLPDERRRGIGTQLLDVAKKVSPDGLTLHVFARNTDARTFYVRHGFMVVDTDDGSGNEEGLPDVTYRWSLGR